MSWPLVCRLVLSCRQTGSLMQVYRYKSLIAVLWIALYDSVLLPLAQFALLFPEWPFLFQHFAAHWLSFVPYGLLLPKLKSKYFLVTICFVYIVFGQLIFAVKKCSGNIFDIKCFWWNHFF